MKIHHKLFLIFFSSSVLLVLSLVLMIQWSLNKGMVDYVNTRELSALAPFIDELKQTYQQTGSWQSWQGRHRQFEQRLRFHLADSDFHLPPRHEPQPPRPFRNADTRFRPEPPKGSERRPPPERERRPPELRSSFDARQPARANERQPQPPKVTYALVDIDKSLIAGIYSPKHQYRFQPIMVDDVNIGYFALPKRNQLALGYELDFVEQQQHNLWYVAIAILAFVMVFTFPLARHLLSPIRSLARGMHNLTQGQYQQTLPLTRKDEFGELNRDFNELALTLATNDQARKRWLANISHELRTPIAILRAELEAMIDGIRALEKTNIESAYQEVRHLQRLVEDLHLLTSADIGGMSYRKTELNLTELLQRETEKFTHYLSSINGRFSARLPEQSCHIFADGGRLSQLLENIVSNSVRYAGAGCLVQLSLEIAQQSNRATIIIEDDGPGVEAPHLAHLFEHLYRVDDSRNRATGGTGLGLSICAHIVQAHQGQISAEKSTLGGLAVIIRLPLSV